jgi:hypothetical protein
MPVAEIEFVEYPAHKPRIVGYEPWKNDSLSFAIPPHHRQNLKAMAKQLIAMAAQAATVGCTITAVWISVDKKNHPFILESRESDLVLRTVLRGG